MAKRTSLLIGPDEKVSKFEATILGLQHVLAMDVYVPPIILAGILAMSSACLLYTSPSPRDVEESRMPSSA